VADKLRTVLQQPLTIDGVALDLDASIGIAMYPEHGTNVDTLMQRADVAMYMAKNNGGGFQHYVPERDDYSASKLAMGSELRYAIDGNELVLYYQPKVHLRTGRVQGVEALVRWDHPQKGLVSPDDFIALADKKKDIYDGDIIALIESIPGWYWATPDDTEDSVGDAAAQPPTRE
jgi:predicted signal transduction protein with EAL and GGDEF domain